MHAALVAVLLAGSFAARAPRVRTGGAAEVVSCFATASASPWALLQPGGRAAAPPCCGRGAGAAPGAPHRAGTTHQALPGPDASSGGRPDAEGGGRAAGDAPERPPRYPVPVLGTFAVADAEINVALSPLSRRAAVRGGDPRAQQDAQRRRGRQKNKPGFKPVAGLGAMLGFLAAGPAGAIAGATASVMTSGKDSLAGDTVRTAAKAAETLGTAAWDVTSKAASAAKVEDFVRKGVDAVDDSVEGFRKRGRP